MKLKKLNFLGSVLYVAAHPDDENTRVIAYLANERFAATAYLSMTRGDGGQNLIGSEIRDELGLIRTQELLAARKIDGGEQFFTRVNDFGFSKNQQETFEIWNKTEVLSDVVKVIRQYQPDVIITRFPPDERAGHGHHTASAVLAQEAFDLAANASAYPKQLEKYTTWQTKRLFTNTGRWWNTTIDEKTPGVVTLNVGLYNSLLGKSYSEIAAESRTQHKSQGFGSPGRRGDAPEYFEWVKGEKAQSDIFDQVNTAWTRLSGGEKIQPMVTGLIAEFDLEHPEKSIPALIAVRKAIDALPASVWRTRKMKEVDQLLQDCAGLYAEVVSSVSYSPPGRPVSLTFEVVNRAGGLVQLNRLSSKVLDFDSTLALTLPANRLVTFKSKRTIRKGTPYSTPYWLQQEHTQGLFNVMDEALIGKPANDPAVVIEGEFSIGGQPVMISMPLIRKWTDPVKGELWEPFEVTPDVSVSLSPNVLLFPDSRTKAISVAVKSYAEQELTGSVQLNLPAGWRAVPNAHSLKLAKRGDEMQFTFDVTPPEREEVARLGASVTISENVFSTRVKNISYAHIPTQTIQFEEKAKVVRLNIARSGNLIGYVKGAGDEIPAALRNLGYEVWEMTNEEVTRGNLEKLSAVVLGVRALNTNERIRFLMPALLEYVKQGGTMVVQYNTNFDLEIEPDRFSPFSLKLSRDRVTEEDSEVSFLKPDHPLLNYPNKISSADFDSWVQERGLYFPSEWSPEFEPLLSMRDANEPERKGSLLVAKYGNGNYIYTGLSFFRELPEGVPGAFKLFANLVSAGSAALPKNVKNKPSKK